MRIFPLVGVNRPAIILIVVVFPAPLGPRKPKNSPGFTINDKSSTAAKLPNFFVTFWSSIMRLDWMYGLLRYSHSMVAGGLELMSYTTRLIPLSSLMILLEAATRTSCGIFAQSAVIPSTLVTARRATVDS